MKTMVYVLLADGFEEIEALAPVDFLRRAEIPVTTVSLTGKIVCGAHGISVTADADLKDLDFSDADGIVLPGGMPGATHLDQCPQMTEILSSVYNRGGILSAICAAPLVLGKRGYLQNKEATCYPGFEENLIGARLSSRPVVCDGRIITAKSAAYAWEFASSIAEAFAGKDRCQSVRSALFLPPFGG
ncbi:MAG: DJ-1/PfpI family protein [Clostridia bacterium]|nr:DJ-1/PfpI family protein [Clostridia bacterium]